MKVIDCFTFYNELDMLKFRLAELNDVVDYFILVEATRTFVGKSKELFYDNNKHLFSQYADKIIHIIVDDMPISNDAWNLERHQRRCIDRGLKTLSLDPSDIIIISDVDEIPDTNTLKILVNRVTPSNVFIYNLQQDMYYYNITCKGDKWYHSKVLNYITYDSTYDRDVENIRMSHFYNPIPSIANGGWHFSYFGGVEFIKNKIQNFSHQEVNNPDNLQEDKIIERIKNCDDLFGRNDVKFTHINIEDNKYLPRNYQLLMN